MKKLSSMCLSFSAALLLLVGMTACKPELIPHEHTYSDSWEADEENHWHKATCEHKDEISGLTAHIWNTGEITLEATEDTEGEKTFTCTVCKKTKTEVIAKLSHTHKYADAWLSDASQHWHECSGCKEKGSLENHVWDDGEVTKAATTKEEGVKTYTCTVCSATKEEAIEKLSKNDKTNDGSNDDDPPVVEPAKKTYPNDKNPTAAGNAAASLDAIFSLDSVGFTTITIRRSEWNKMLTYFDYFYKNENSVIAESYTYEKDGQTWELNTVGLRLRGATSRFRPQGKNKLYDELGNKQPNADWSESYYNYAQTCSDDDYRQSHFKVDFEPLDDDDRKMSDCMKGVALKRPDSLFTKEIFCYNLFHEFGIWTAPRASQTKVYIDFVEDLDTDGKAKEDITGCSKTRIDFGVYEMFEEVNKQSLKARASSNGNNNAATAWTSNGGDLWKCAGGDLTSAKNVPSNFGVEKVLILNTDKPKSQWSHVWDRPCYDLKTNKSDVTKATERFQSFQTELNNLSNTTAGTTAGTKARKDFYEKWFDVDFFIKTYAVNILVGMDDDYWGNANNYYLYFDNGKKGSGKCYFIPFDYDNTLGSSIKKDQVVSNPLEWGNGEDRPLLDRLLEVPEYKEKMINTLLEVSSQDANSPWNKEHCYSLWNQWHNQVRPYVSTPDIKNGAAQNWANVCALEVSDIGGWRSVKHYLTSDNDNQNIYEQTTQNFIEWLTYYGKEIKFDLNGGSLGSETGVVTRIINDSFDYSMMIANPNRDNYVFVGWTKTKNSSDYVEKYEGEENLTLYASWINITGVTGLTIFEVPDSSYDGIKIYIANLPDNHYRRSFFINGKEVGGDDAEKSENNQNVPNDKYKQIWAYPFTEKGKTYEIKVSYKNEGYGELETSNTISVVAKSGIGEFKVTNTPEYKIENNILKWIAEPEVQMGNLQLRTNDNWDEYYLLELQSTHKPHPNENEGEWDWTYISWNNMGASCNNNFNFMEHLGNNETKLRNGYLTDLKFTLKYNYKSSPYGDLFLIIYDYNDVEPFNLEFE